MAAVNPGKMLLGVLTCLVCQDYFKDPACLDCGHNFCQACNTQCWQGLHEAAEDYKEKIQSYLEILKKEREEILSLQSSGENKSQELLKQLKKKRQKIASEFQRLCQFLEERQKFLLAQLEELNKEIEKNTLSSGLLYKVNVTLDPDTAHPELIVSADRRSVRRGDTQPALPKNIERFDTALCVLGCEGFTSGRHYWEVDVKVEIEVEGKGFWAMGVARESVSRKGPLSFTPEQGIWALEGCEDEFWTHTLTEQFNSFSRSRAPNRIRVYLDYERGRVEFVNAGSGDVILTFPSASFAGEGIYPFFWVGFRGSGSRLTLCP